MGARCYQDLLEWLELNSILREHAAAWMLWEDEPLQKNREHLSESGIKVIVFRPVMNRPEKGDFMTIMEVNIKTLAEAF